MIFALLAAWDWFYRNERLILQCSSEVEMFQLYCRLLIVVLLEVRFS